jgi:hypothetical protein
MHSPIESAAEALDAVVATVQRLREEKILAAEPCGSGGNNRVYRIRTARASFAAKFYGTMEVDGRDRLGHEFDGLRFLKTSGTGAAVPEVLAVDRDARCALYEWVDGRVAADHTVEDIPAVIGLLTDLHGARESPGASNLPAATEAVFRLADLRAQIERRLERLDKAATSDPELADFLTRRVRPEFERRINGLDEGGPDAALPSGKRTLSPSDFGFHNALRRTDRSLVFIDFEYFGWDDPVKATADFLLHPATKLSAAEKRAFVEGALALYGSDPDFLPRLTARFPLYGIRWSLIILNEFVPELWKRRTFSGKGEDWAGAKLEQLRKARLMLETMQAYNEGQFIT